MKHLQWLDKILEVQGSITELTPTICCWLGHSCLLNSKDLFQKPKMAKKQLLLAKFHLEALHVRG